jgi:mannosyltransferase OCH1-like enzyme
MALVIRMMRRRCIGIKVCFMTVIIGWSVCMLTYLMLRRRSPQQTLNAVNIFRLSNVSWTRRRIPRLLHQTWRTRDVPLRWNKSFQSVLKFNIPEFAHRLWTDAEVDEFVREKEPEFYARTFVNYHQHIQRIDSFRYVVLFHLGGVYLDLDNGCSQSLGGLLTTLEALDPDSTHLAGFPFTEPIGLLNNFMISTAGHPLLAQLISRLHLFDHYFFIDYLTVLLSTGPLYLTIQEHLFQSSNEHAVRLIAEQVANPMFTNSGGGSTWQHKDGKLILHYYYNRKPIFYRLIIVIILSQKVLQPTISPPSDSSDSFWFSKK